MAVSTTSCEDWLTLYPQDRVVEEDFWEDKNDLEGVRYGAYKQMCSTLEKTLILLSFKLAYAKFCVF